VKPSSKTSALNAKSPRASRLKQVSESISLLVYVNIAGMMILMIQFTSLDPKTTPEHLGLIPMFLSESSPLAAREQFHNNYGHGGGWQPMSGFTLNPDLTLQYGDPEEEDADPPLSPLAATIFKDELILIYPSAWVAIVQRNGSLEVSRMD
jgi:hypothetical protein